ncbi:glycosyltransferase [Vibrio profundum]|uniref:glycosyltransferase family 2 protein n=1 Tax=Vibrio profundum TaxID=2910247 RepID=UPI003D0DA444
MNSLLTETPLISIGITCFNAESTIQRVIKSALAQNWQEVEIIVVDDCSTDRSWEKLAYLSSVDSRVKAFRHSINKGYPAALNTMLEHARGEFVAIFDDDDDNLPDRLQIQIKRIVDYEQKSKAELVLCYSNRDVVKGGQTEVDHVALAIGRSAPEPYGLEVADYVFGTHATPGRVWGMFGSCTLMARRTSFKTIGLFDDNFRRSAELDFAVRAALLGTHFIAVDQALITQYKTSGSYKSGRIPLKYALLLREKHRSLLDQRGLYQASRFIARSNFYGNKHQYFRGYIYRAIAYICSIELLSKFIHRRLISRK